MPGKSLAEWLEYIEQIHPKSIQLGLERVARVRHAMGKSTAAALLTVAGTNGKGSTCAMLESILLAAGYKVGLYTSPHLLRYNERVRLDGVPVSDERLCAAFESVERARGEVSLTYFEFGTLATWEIFTSQPLDALILEVGLGGRLDAVNAFDTDCAILTSIDLDHMEYLGDTRERIGAEKAGIFRAGKPAIVADADPPRSVLERAEALGADLRLIGRDFGFRQQGQQWLYWGPKGRRGGLAPPAFACDSRSACRMYATALPAPSFRPGSRCLRAGQR
jgi:dihydrofolate synthase/folylpolyglutamate synthase